MIDAKDFSAAARALREFDPGDELEAAERRIGDVVVENVRAEARRHRVSGRLERSIGAKAVGDGAATTVRVTAGAPHAHLIAGGTRSHTIRPVRSHALAIHRGATITGYADAVRHPGTKAHPFFADGVDASEAEISQILERTGEAIVDELATSIRRR